MSKPKKTCEFHCRFTKNTRQKMKALAKKMGLSQSDLLERLVSHEFEKMQDSSWDCVFVQLHLFADLSTDESATLFDNIEEHNVVSA